MVELNYVKLNNRVDNWAPTGPTPNQNSAPPPSVNGVLYL